MILTLVLASSLQSYAASEFFPVVNGTVATFQEVGSTFQLVRAVGKALDMGGVPVVPITETETGKSGATVYYKVDADAVSIVASDLKHPLSPPLPIFRIGSKKVEWDYEGKTMTGPQGERLVEHGESHSIGQREFQGKKVDAIEVNLHFSRGVGLTGQEYDQRAVYARGIGLVEFSSKMKLGQSKHVTEIAYKLLSVAPPKPGE